MVPTGPSQVQNVSVADVHDMGVVMQAGGMILVSQPVTREVPGPVQCLKRGTVGAFKDKSQGAGT